jgi:hypothetical protein
MKICTGADQSVIFLLMESSVGAFQPLVMIDMYLNVNQ